MSKVQHPCKRGVVTLALACASGQLSGEDAPYSQCPREARQPAQQATKHQLTEGQQCPGRYRGRRANAKVAAGRWRVVGGPSQRWRRRRQTSPGKTGPRPATLPRSSSTPAGQRIGRRIGFQHREQEDGRQRQADDSGQPSGNAKPIHNGVARIPGNVASSPPLSDVHPAAEPLTAQEVRPILRPDRLRTMSHRGSSSRTPMPRRSIPGPRSR